MDVNGDNYAALRKGVEYLLNKGADINEVFRLGVNYFKHAMIKLCIERDVTLIHVRDNEVLRKMSTWDHNIDIVEYLISKGADVHALDDKPLRNAAAKYGNLNIVRLLVENGACIDAKNFDALHKAAFENHIEVLRYLVETYETTNQDTRLLREELNNILNLAVLKRIEITNHINELPPEYDSDDSDHSYDYRLHIGDGNTHATLTK